MSEIKKKRMPKTKNELVEKLVDKKAEDFKKELAALEDKYSFRIQPQLHFSQRGIIPTLIVVPVTKEVIEVKKAKPKKEDVV